ncbi:MAG: TlpA family protein disulfide reductase [Kiritimatiellae bacterium]|nr:TlpA family protein disulfide reductase [Kiritimatiellia bacterium]MDW8457542.1 TlpA disulfide reductase family protein [Verrucomicrobiota bacterium]
MKRILLLTLATAAILGVPARAQNAPELNRVLSQLQAMSHGTYSPKEWQETMQELDRVAAQAAANGNSDLVVQARAVKAMALADMRRDLVAALRVIEDTKREYGQQRLPSVRRLFIQQADYLARLGDADGVRRTIEEFRRNPNYDAEDFPVFLHEGRNTPMTIARPFARGSDSTSVTAMEAARDRSRYAPGNLFPDFEWTDASGRRGSILGLRGKVVLVDFWHPQWTPWARDLPTLKRLYATWKDRGFEIVGVALGRDTEVLRRFVQTERLPWTIVYGENELPRQLGLHGQASNFLLDANGVILARDLRGSDLAEVVRRAMAR